MISGLFLIEIGSAASDAMGAYLDVEPRRTELISKGYTVEQAALMINFELGYTLTAASLTGVVAGGRAAFTGPLGEVAIAGLTSYATYPFYREAAQIISEAAVDNGQDLSQKEFSIDLPGFSSFKLKLVDLFNSAEDALAAIIHRRDPLIFDLDGDGLETTTLANGVYFDHDVNGFAETSAWVGADDGMIVIDSNQTMVLKAA